MADPLAICLNCLFGMEPDTSFAELRFKLAAGGMGREFHGVRDPGLPDLIRRRGADTDLYIGVAPRARRDGTKAGIDRVHALWADIDTPGALERLRTFKPRPGMVIRSGSPDSVHAYWSLWPPATPGDAERANRQLVQHIGADERATDAARILRPPGTLNHKHQPPAPVTLAHLEIEIHTLNEVLANVPQPPAAGPPKPPRGRALLAADDPLGSIPPPVYIEALTGLEVGRDGKVVCPFHDDRTPSLHVYPEASQGWVCFGCDRGGTIIDLGSELYGLEPRGSGYHRIRERLEVDLVTNLKGAA